MSKICFSSNECSFLIYTCIICNFENFSAVSSSMASKMAAKFEYPIYWGFLLFFLNKSIHFCY